MTRTSDLNKLLMHADTVYAAMQQAGHNDQ